MAAPNMAAMTASLEKSLQNFSLNHHHEHSSSSSSSRSSSSSNNISGRGELRCADDNKSSAADSPANLDLLNDSSLDLHSEIPLPHFWEQCLDLKSGEIYYINWRTGMKSQEDPRTNPEINADCYSDEDEDDDSCSYDSEESSSESFRTVVEKEDWRQYNISWENNRDKNIVVGGGSGSGGDRQVLVVTGCKSCLMYFMVPKEEEDCPKCCGQLLHFDRSGST